MGRGCAVFYATPLYAPLSILWASLYTSHSAWAVLWLVLSWIWLIGWFPAIYFLHFKKENKAKKDESKEESSEEVVGKDKQFFRIKRNR